MWTVMSIKAEYEPRPDKHFLSPSEIIVTIGHTQRVSVKTDTKRPVPIRGQARIDLAAEF
jgi:hypothetical protein